MGLDDSILAADRIGRRLPGSGKWLMRDISVQIRAGQVVAIQGPSGAGKSLLLRALAQLDQVDEGQILWQGRSVSAADMPRYRSHVIYVQQRPALLDGTVADNLQHPFSFAVHRPRVYDANDAQHWLQQLDRDGSYLRKPSRTLSGGESQLVALVRALLLNPQVLLLDEPTGALDPKTRQAVERVLQQWVQKSTADRSLLLVSHDHQQAARIADRVLRMDAGRLIEAYERQE